MEKLNPRTKLGPGKIMKFREVIRMVMCLAIECVSPQVCPKEYCLALLVFVCGLGF
jgi:hypothetical protein